MQLPRFWCRAHARARLLPKSLRLLYTHVQQKLKHTHTAAAAATRSRGLLTTGTATSRPIFQGPHSLIQFSMRDVYKPSCSTLLWSSTPDVNHHPCTQHRERAPRTGGEHLASWADPVLTAAPPAHGGPRGAPSPSAHTCGTARSHLGRALQGCRSSSGGR